jgi:GTP-binding protein LepA
MLNKIRNFSIIAHIDHGKSTLADRMLEITGTIDKRKMKDQVLDDMELERERGITIKMRPVTMKYQKRDEKGTPTGDEYILNLIDTPGHIDFSYEVSRALQAVEGTLLLVDSTQGVQAQTLTTLNMAKELGLVIIPVLTKVDAPTSRVDDIKREIVNLINCDPDDILLTSGKTGEGVDVLLEKIVEKVPAPKIDEKLLTAGNNDFRSLIFDFQYSDHKGIIVYMRVFNGSVTKGQNLVFNASKRNFSPNEVGIFKPEPTKVDKLEAGEIGYIITGIKEPNVAFVGDTVMDQKSVIGPLSGYQEPKPVVWASVFPESQDDFTDLRFALEKLKLTDSSLTFEEESSGVLGRGFRCGFLGMLHLEIITERLRREFNLELVVTLPSIIYIVHTKRGERKVCYSASAFPDHGEIDRIEEPWTEVKIILPNEYLGDVMTLLFKHEAVTKETETLSDNRSSIVAEVPLRELMRNFFDELKSATSGYASLSYEIGEYRPAEVCKLEVLVADEEVPAFSKIVSKMRVQEEAEATVEKLYKILPRQMFAMKVQGKAMGRIISSKSISALRKNVTAHLYGGDITRKMKLREKQKKGKKKMADQGKVKIGADTFLKMIKSE